MDPLNFVFQLPVIKDSLKKERNYPKLMGEGDFEHFI